MAEGLSWQVFNELAEAGITNKTIASDTIPNDKESGSIVFVKPFSLTLLLQFPVPAGLVSRRSYINTDITHTP
jgi:hypothetical protein